MRLLIRKVEAYANFFWKPSYLSRTPPVVQSRCRSCRRRSRLGRPGGQLSSWPHEHDTTGQRSDGQLGRRTGRQMDGLSDNDVVLSLPERLMHVIMQARLADLLADRSSRLAGELASRLADSSRSGFRANILSCANTLYAYYILDSSASLSAEPSFPHRSQRYSNKPTQTRREERTPHRSDRGMTPEGRTGGSPRNYIHGSSRLPTPWKLPDDFLPNFETLGLPSKLLESSWILDPGDRSRKQTIHAKTRRSLSKKGEEVVPVLRGRR